ncbi:uncharacterized protein CG3556-like [Uloborus diversus]|uniref:uncharacterized protein CG3556-like n=1 Tax=Uloborus diversus TaxID=327109 RepID=UPI00240A4A51|nr:uncharacterized protein CG3556-like [Uloborus diversus]
MLDPEEETDIEFTAPSTESFVNEIEYEVENEVFGSQSNDSCPQIPAGGMEWLLHVWNPDLGWKSETPRAIIAMAVNGWLDKDDVTIKQMELQLDLEITKFLLRSGNFALEPTRLAMYIQALVALNRNPRNFHGFDLVERLLSNVKGSRLLHPFVVLALCNVQAVDYEHLKAITRYTQHINIEDKNNTEFKSIALKALSCANSLGKHFDFSGFIKTAYDCLMNQQKPDGTFGNIYTTALAIQALIACKTDKPWKKEDALNRLREMSLKEQSVYGVYSAELALKADIYPFVKDIHQQPPFSPPQALHGNRIHYTLRNDRRSEVELTISINVPDGSTLFDLMSSSANADANFKFSFYLDSDERPHIFEVNGVPNDAEENFYWRLCRQKRMPGKSNGSMLQTVLNAPTVEKVDPEHHIVLWYRNANCEVLNSH